MLLFVIFPLLSLFSNILNHLYQIFPYFRMIFYFCPFFQKTYN